MYSYIYLSFIYIKYNYTNNNFNFYIEISAVIIGYGSYPIK